MGYRSVYLLTVGFLLLHIGELLATTECPQRCRCNVVQETLTVNCSSAGLTKFPVNIPPETKVLLLNNNRIRLESKFFEDLVNLETLEISENNMKTLSNGVFIHLGKLLTLDLSRNKLNFLNDSTLLD